MLGGLYKVHLFMLLMVYRKRIMFGEKHTEWVVQETVRHRNMLKTILALLMSFIFVNGKHLFIYLIIYLFIHLCIQTARN